MLLDAQAISRLRSHLEHLYGDDSTAALETLSQVLAQYGTLTRDEEPSTWDERDVALIAYGDQIHAPDKTSLAALGEFLDGAGFDQLLNTIHLLPFFPYSSDDGFSVIDYRQVDPKAGTWEDIDRLGSNYRLAFDLVLNHCSRESQWFKDYLAGKPPYDEYFVEADPTVDLSAVTRPRSLPLLTEFETSRGTRHLWTTFSDDQIDLNYASPKLMAEMMDVLLFYVQHGARIVRLDAIAYLWKEPGTTCIHLPRTHTVVRLMREVLSMVAPGVWLLSETNVPHQENISYFGAGDEAQLVYQFSLPPLLLDAYLNEDAGPLTAWLPEVCETLPGTTFFNFTASHDGVGVRPLEGLVPNERIDRLVEAVKQRGGAVSTRKRPDGTDSPYELNISYLSALGEPGGMDPTLHARRFLASQAIMLSLRGIPGIYFHSLVGTPNDVEGWKSSGIPRRINRHRYELSELESVLGEADGLQAQVLEGYQHLLKTRIAQSAFHPEAQQHPLVLPVDGVFGFVRQSNEANQQIVVLANLCGTSRSVDLSVIEAGPLSRDLLTGQNIEDPTDFQLQPYQVVWLEAKSH
ncbi:unnamed protein product [Cladocopium goreaui]|uniref:Glucosylglycerate phosphorylase (GGa phosphorylase) (GGaP) n=1 Tax=Cladocopium goreaui TaxID=2562237 RepID=A0A9P1BG64_9DINO|nr:unnamed protein product [Cladocopium goreaui]